MSVASKRVTKVGNPLDSALRSADRETLVGLVGSLAASRPESRRKTLEYLRKRVAMNPATARKVSGDVVRTLWEELEPDLAELDECGGGPHDVEDNVGDLLYDLSEKLKKKGIPKECRRDMVEEVLPYLKSRNSGMEDALYEVAYAACHDDEDWRNLAERLESLPEDWPKDHARRIYCKLGDRKKYLTLRLGDMKYGADYHDLATFYWKCGERSKALEVAREGLAKGEGRMDELRSFLAERAKAGGDRKAYIELQFAQAADQLTLEAYKAFRKCCRQDEWKAYEPKVLLALERAWFVEKLKIRMFRKEYEQAIGLLLKGGHERYDGGTLFKIAKQLETGFPKQVLAFYLSVLGDLEANAVRAVYAEKARTTQKVRHMWLDVMGEPGSWKRFAREIKTANLKKPAFQEEFARALPDWKDL